MTQPLPSTARSPARVIAGLIADPSTGPAARKTARPLGRLAALLLAASLSACASLGGGGDAPSIYDLTAPTDFAGVSGRAPAQLLVPAPVAVEAFASNRVVVRPAPGQISYYPGASWSDDLPTLVQTKLLRAFENSGRARAVGLPGQSLAIDYQVLIDIRAFEYDAVTDTAHVELGAKLLDDRTGRVRATEVFSARVPASADTAPGVIAALDAASGQVFTAIVQWAAKVI